MKSTLSLFFLLIVSGLSAQIPLDEYRTAVAEYSWQLKRAITQSNRAVEAIGQARTGFLPQLSAEGSFSTTIRKMDESRRWTFSLQPRVVQTIYGGGAVRAAFRASELDYDIALCNEEFSRLEVRYAADYAYWNLSAMEQFATSMRQYVAIIRSLKSVVGERFSEGYIAKGDVLMIETRLSEAEYQLVTAEQNYEVALHNFNILRGTDPEMAVILTNGIRDSLPMPMRVSLNDALLRRSDYIAARLRVERAEIDIRTARASFNPQLRVSAGAPWRPYSPNRSGRTYLDGVVAVELSVPIFHWGERRRSVGMARATQQQYEWEMAQIHDDIIREEMNGWTTLVDSRAQVNTSERNLRIAGENLEISTYSYGEGLATILDVLQAQLSWIQLYTNAIQAHYNFAIAASDYQRITAQ